METLVIVLISLGIVVVGIGLSLLLKHYNISLSTVFKGVDTSKTILAFVKVIAKDMKLDEDIIDKVSDIIMDALEYIKSIPDGVSREVKIEAGVQYAEELCYTLDIPLNDDRKVIITTLITAAYNLYESIRK